MGHLALIAATVIWGVASVVIKHTLEHVPVYTFLFLRFLIVGMLLFPFVFLELKKNPIHKRDLVNFVLMGIFAQTSLIFIFEGLKYTTALDSAVIGVIAPILTLAAGHYFFREKINNKVKLGVIIATIGTAFVALEPIFTAGNLDVDVRRRLWGNFLVVLNTLAFLVYIIWSKISLGQSTKIVKRALHFMHLKPMHKKYTAFQLMGVSFYIGLATFIPFALAENFGLMGPVNFSFDALPLSAWLGIVYMAVLSSIVAYILFEWALHSSSVGDTAIYSYLTPLVTLPFAYVLLHESPTLAMLLGSGIIAIGVVIAEHHKT